MKLSRLPDGFSMGPMTADEVLVLFGWASIEGWNPGLSDARIAWDYDPAAFIALRKNGQLVGGGAILSYGGRFGFMGLFIVREDHRHGGLGRLLWNHRRDSLRARLHPGATIGMDGVLAMVPFYERGGFRFCGTDLRFEGVASGTTSLSPEVRPLGDFPFEEVDRFDQIHVPAPRTGFLRRWIQQPGAHAVGVGSPGSLAGYGVLRPCESGFKIGPLFAADATAAEQLLGTLLSRVPGAQVQIDVPDSNVAAVSLAAALGFRETFRCARLYLGGIPDLPKQRIFGVTSFEFG